MEMQCLLLTASSFTISKGKPYKFIIRYDRINRDSQAFCLSDANNFPRPLWEKAYTHMMLINRRIIWWILNECGNPAIASHHHNVVIFHFEEHYCYNGTIWKNFSLSSSLFSCSSKGKRSGWNGDAELVKIYARSCFPLFFLFWVLHRHHLHCHAYKKRTEFILEFLLFFFSCLHFEKYFITSIHRRVQRHSFTDFMPFVWSIP